MPRQYKAQTWGKRPVAYAARAKSLRERRAQSMRRAAGRVGGARGKARIEKTLLGLREPKFYNDAQYAAAECANDLVLAQISGPPQGDDNNSRDGDRIHVDWIKVRGIIAKQADNGVEHVRIVIFKWLLDDTLTVPVISDVLDTTTWGAAAAAYCAYNQTSGHLDRYRVVVDKTFRLIAQNGVLPQSNQIQFAFHIKVNDELKFAPGVVTGTGQYYMIACTNNAQGAAVGPTITCRALMQFRDL